jgi:hypothetical protein
MLREVYAKNYEKIDGMKSKTPAEYYGIGKSEDRLYISRAGSRGGTVQEDVLVGSTSWEAWLLKTWYLTMKQYLQNVARYRTEKYSNVRSLHGNLISCEELDEIVINAHDEFIGRHEGVSPISPWRPSDISSLGSVVADTFHKGLLEGKNLAMETIRPALSHIEELVELRQIDRARERLKELSGRIEIEAPKVERDTEKREEADLPTLPPAGGDR